jgi:non-homologous end joining protein Ku
MMQPTGEEEKVRFQVLNRRTGHRILSQDFDPETGRPVDDADRRSRL